MAYLNRADSYQQARQRYHARRASEFAADAAAIRGRRQGQDAAMAVMLAAHHQKPLFGEVAPWTLVEMLARVIDPVDEQLYGASQWLHVAQMIDAMEADGTATEEMILAAIVHDLGKLMLLTGTEPEHVVWMRYPLDSPAPGCGLDACTMHFGHDELAWSRLRSFLPDPIAWLVRYHSIGLDRARAYMSDRDKDYVETYLTPFRHYDMTTKSPFFTPARSLEDYRPVVEKYLPSTVQF